MVIYMKDCNKKEKLPVWLKMGITLCISVFLIGGFITGKAVLENRKGEQAYEALRMEMSVDNYERSITKPAADVLEEEVEKTSAMDFTALKEINKEAVGWLRLEGSIIDYPVMHTDDNDYYIKHIYTGEANKYGALFADYRNTGLFTDKNTVIYGHNMLDGSMFSALAEYKQQDYYEQFPTMLLYTPEGDYRIELFCGTVEGGNYEFVQFSFDSDEEFMEYIEGFRERSTFISDVIVEPEDRIVSLSTCSYENDNARYMVMGKLVPVD